MESEAGAVVPVEENQVLSAFIQLPEVTNLCIDTCSLIILLSEQKANFLIGNLEFWVLNNRIRLFTNKVIIDEWNRHKEKRREEFRQGQQAKYSHTLEVLKIENLTVPKDLQPNTEAYDKLITRIDNLLKGATLVDVSTDVKAKSAERFGPPRKPPFHNKANSMNDAFIILSAMEYFNQRKESFIFVSDNKGEFASPDECERTIHPELVEDYPGVTVEYYRDIGRAISDLRKMLDIALHQEETSITVESKATPAKISLDKSKPLLDQLAQYMEIMHQDIVYVPPMFIINHYPFRIGNENSSHYSLFNAESSNEKLLEMFRHLAPNENGVLPEKLLEFFPNVPGALEKCKKVLQHLTRDLIFSISNTRGGRRISTRFVADGKTCHCPICEFRRFKFVDALKQVADEPKDERQYLQLAYANYQCGNYLKAVRILQRARSILKDKNLVTSSFLVEFNLSKLGIFLYNKYFNNKEIEAIANSLKEIKPSSLITTYAVPHNRELLEYLSEDNFFKNTKDRIHELHYKILETYLQSLVGTFSSNSYAWSMKNQLAQIDSFLTDNRIIFDRFTDFSNLADRIFDALFASHAIKASAGSRLPNFDDWTLQRMMLYGTAENFNKYYLRYRIKKLVYESSDADGTFIDILNNFFSDTAMLKQTVEKYCEQDGQSFWSCYNRLFANAIVLVSITQLSASTITALIRKIIDFLVVEDCIEVDNLRYVRSLIIRSEKDLDTELLSMFFWVVVENKKYLETHCIEAICDIYSSRKTKLSINDEQFKLIKERYMEIDAEGAIQNVHIPLIHICRIVKEVNYANEFKAMIRNYLKIHFNFALYYQAAIFDVVPYDDADFDKLLGAIFPSEGRQEIKGFLFGKPSDRYDGVNDFINLAFKVGLETTQERFDAIQKLSPYYEWLLDMENFNYDRFEPAWVSEYKTRFYFRKMASCPKIREFLETRLKDEVIPDLEKQYYSIYIRKPWDVPEE